MADHNFRLFPRLPLELQGMIWVASMVPREVVITMALEAGARPGPRTTVILTTRNPAQMATTREARYTFLRHYTKMYVSFPWVVSGLPGVVYLHPSLDVVSQDFEVVFARQGDNRIRVPGAVTRSMTPVNFCDALSILPAPVIAPWSFPDPLGSLRHVQVNIHVVMSSRRNPAGTYLNTTAAFVQALMQRSKQTGLQTITIRMTRDLTPPPAGPVIGGLRPLVFRIVRPLPLPITKPNVVFSGLVAEIHLAQLGGEKAVCPSLVDILAADAAIFNFPSKTDFIALRVIDPKSTESEYDDFGKHWPGRERERLFFEMLERSAKSEYKTVTTWLAHLLQYPHTMMPLQGQHWGLCGAHYGLEGAKGISRPTDLVNWRWH